MSNSAMMEFARAIDGLLMKLKYGYRHERALGRRLRQAALGG